MLIFIIVVFTIYKLISIKLKDNLKLKYGFTFLALDVMIGLLIFISPIILVMLGIVEGGENYSLFFFELLGVFIIFPLSLVAFFMGRYIGKKKQQNP